MSDQDTDHFIDGIAAELRRPVRIDPRFDARVMAALEPQVIPLHAGRRERRHAWLRRPWTVSFSPLGALGGLAVAAGISAIFAMAARRSGGESAMPLAAGTTAEQPVELHPVASTGLVARQFVFMAPDARSVHLVGEFNDWDPRRLPLTRREDGLWEVTVPLSAGRHEYQFVVDGKAWRQDPLAPLAPEGDFGQRNSVATVSAGGVR